MQCALFDRPCCGVFSRETNVWLSVKECICLVYQLLAWVIKLCRVLGGQKAKNTQMV